MDSQFAFFNRVRSTKRRRSDTLACSHTGRGTGSEPEGMELLRNSPYKISPEPPDCFSKRSGRSKAIPNLISPHLA